jgi:PAS domain S-box-containing protein
MAGAPSSTPDELFRIALEASPVGYLVVDHQGRIVLVNREIERMFGYDRAELVGKRVELLVPNAARAGHVALREGFMASSRPRPMGACRALFGKRKDGALIPVEVGLNPIDTAAGPLVLGSVIDVSARRELEERLRHAEKMEAVGVMAGGIAHDFNNILMAVVGFSELVRDSLPADAPQRADLRRVLEAAERGRQLVRRILLFSRHEEAPRTVVRLHEVVHEALVLVRASLPASIDIREDLDPFAPPVRCDVTQMHRVIMNLATNSAQAMPEGVGVLRIAATPFHADATFVAAHPGSHAGLHARLTFADTGVGMPPEVAARVFEPFFTTKERGEGTGLGLSVIHGIVVAHGGAIDLRSRVGEGTTVDIYLPVAEVEDAAEVSDEQAAPQGRKHILFVEGSEVLLELGRRQLTAQGYRVTGYHSSLEALADFASRPDGFDLLITDNNMPHMPGQVLVAEVLKVRPRMKVLMVSGLVEGFDPEKLRQRGIRWVLRKPHTSAELAAAVHQAIEASE